MEVSGQCPYCGEPISFWIDRGGSSKQHYVEDCAVCCRPIEVDVVAGSDEEGEPYLALRRDDD